MATVLIVAYLLIVLALVTVILLQRSEGGGLGMGSSSNGFMTVRGTANVLTRATGILAALFFASAIGLTLLNGSDHSTDNILQNAAGSGANGKATSVLDAINAAQKQTEQQSGTAPAAPAPTASTPAPASTPANQDAPNVALPANDNSSATPAATSSAPASSTAAPATTSTTTAPAAAPAATGSSTSGSSTTAPAAVPVAPAAPASQ